MPKQTRHHADRALTTHPDAGLPGPGQALIGYPEPPTSLFGVPQQVARPAAPPAPPRPRTAQENYLRSRTHRPPPAPVPPRRRHRPQALGFPLAVLVLGVALGVIVVVMLVAAGVPAPWPTGSAAARPDPSALSGPSVSEPISGEGTTGDGTAATAIEEDGRYLVGTQLRAGGQVSRPVLPSCSSVRGAGSRLNALSLVGCPRRQDLAPR